MSSLPHTERLAAERDRWVAAGTAGRPFFVASASGARITDVDGREFIDFVSGIGGTYGGNPLSCAAASVAIARVLDPAFGEAAVSLGRRLRAGLDDLARSTPAVGEVRGLGAMLAIEMVRDPSTREPAPELASAVMDAAFDRGLLLMGAGIHSNCIRILVPLVAADADIDEGLGILAESFAEAAP